MVELVVELCFGLMEIFILCLVVIKFCIIRKYFGKFMVFIICNLKISCFLIFGDNGLL